MLRIDHALRSDRVLQALTSLSISPWIPASPVRL